MITRILKLIPLAATLLAASCSMNPRFDVPYSAKGAPSLVEILDKMYCELMSSVDQLDPADRDLFLKEDMGASLSLQVQGTDSMTPSSNFPPFGTVSLAVSGTASRQRTNAMAQVFDMPVGALYAARDKATVNCATVDSTLGGDLNIARVVVASYEATDAAGFVLPRTAKSGPGGSFSGETDFQITQGVSAGKVSFLISTLMGPTGFTAQNTYTDKLGYSFTPLDVPQKPKPMPVYLVPCPKGEKCAAIDPSSATSMDVTPTPRVLSPDIFDQLNRLSILGLSSNLGTQE